MTGDAQATPTLPPALREPLGALLRDVAFSRLVGVELVEWSPGAAETALVAPPELANLVGTVHGGAVFALADAAFEVACNAYGRVCVGLDASIHYAAAARTGERLVARATELTRSRRVASYRVDVERPDGARCAVVQAVCFRTDRWHLGEDAWPAGWRATF